jgi:hypothetical protein
MSTYSDTTRAIDRKSTNTSLLAVLVLTLALTTSCSMSLVDSSPEVLRYCRVAERSDASSTPDAAGQTVRPVDNATARDCATDAGQGCGGDVVEALAADETVNCAP